MSYQQLLMRFKNEERIIHKKNAGFIEYLLQYLGYDIDHDIYKQLVYGNKASNTAKEKQTKDIYDAYLYLLQNKHTDITVSFLNKFYYILTEKRLDEEIAMKIQMRFYDFEELNPIEKIADICFYMFEAFNQETGELKMLIAMMFLNFMLIRFELVALHMFPPDFNRLLEIKEKYMEGDKDSAYVFLLEKIYKEKSQPKSYYKNLTPLCAKDISDCINKEITIIKDMYQIISMAIFGSFAKNLNRLDSDIDFIIVFQANMSFEERRAKKKQASEFLFHKLKRFIDLHEFSPYNHETLIRGTRQFIKVF